MNNFIEKNIGVSIIVPFKNRFQLFVETYQAVIAQTSSSWELIVVNDKSTEDEYLKLQKLVEGNSKVQLFNNNGVINGAPYCRNLGAKHSKFNFLIFLDSDDIIGENFVKERIQTINQSPNNDFWIYKVQLFKNKPGDTNILWNKFTEENDLDRFLKVDTPWHTTSTLWNKEFFNKIEGFDVNCINWQDWEIHIRALVQKPKYIKINKEIDIFYRKHDFDSISKNVVNKNHLLNRIATIENIIIALQNAHLLNKNRKYLLAKLLFSISNEINDLEIKEEPIRIIKKYALIDSLKLKLWQSYFVYLKDKSNAFKKVVDKLIYFFYGDHFMDRATSFLKVKI